MNTLSQVAIAVDNIEKAKKFFEKLIGKEASPPHHVAQQKVNVSMIKIGDTNLELLEPAAEITPITKFLEQRGGGIHHIGIKTDNFDELIEELKEIGIRTLGEPSIGADGNRIIFFHPKDTYGVLIELEEA
jgi:methylmalonyl-CoA/ethylmalonyl-CoA epimerase